MGCSVNSIKNYFRELVKANLVLVKKESYRSSKYILLKPSDEMLNDGKQEYSSENYLAFQRFYKDLSSVSLNDVDTRQLIENILKLK